MEKKSEQNNLTSICIAVAYFGEWPNYFPFFLKSCEYNPSINWLFYTNCKVPANVPKNVRFVYGSLEDFNTLASQKMQMEINIPFYKKGDLRPAYGHIFEDYLADFDFFGYGDIDVVYGNMRAFLTEEILKSHDVISAYSKFLSGPFTLFKKDQKRLYQGNPDYKKVFTSDQNLNFEETDYVYDQDIFASQDFSIRGKHGICSMSHYLARLTHEGSIQLYAKDLIVNLEQKDKTLILFDKGILIADKVREEFLVHFLFMKVNNGIVLPKGEIKNTFLVCSSGIYYDSKPSYIKKVELYFRITVLSYLKVKMGRFLQKFLPGLYFFYKKNFRAKK